MTAYSNFLQDFPTRCFEVLDNYFEHARDNDLEVTLILSIATTAFVIPFERLRPPPKDLVSFDREIYVEARQKFDRFVNRKFRGSELWTKGTSWKVISELEGSVIREKDAESWAAPAMRRPIEKKTVLNSFLSRLRNSLAHGNILTYPTRRAKEKPAQIEDLIFLSRCYERQAVK